MSNENQVEANAEAAEKPEKKERVSYLTVAGDENIGNEGQLTCIPGSNGTPEFDDKEHVNLRRSDFEHNADFLDFRANRLEARMARDQAEITKLRGRAEQERKFGDPTTRRKVAKLQRVADTMKELQAQLKADGVEIDLSSLIPAGAGDAE